MKYKYKDGGVVKGQDGIPEINGGELNPAVVKPKPVKITLITDPITKRTPITHSSLQASDGNNGFLISKGSDDPSYNLLTANCSDATGECLEILTGENFTKGITTPIGVSRKTRAFYQSQPDYREWKQNGSRYQEFTVPWYDYRRAKDLVEHNRLQRFLTQYSLTPNQQINVIQNMSKTNPTLPYYLDDDNDVHYYKDGGVIKLHKAGIVPVLRRVVSRAPQAVVKLDESLAGTPKTILHVPQVTVSEPYARISRDLSTINTAQSFSIDGDPFNTFQLVKDLEPKQYSVHFKTLGKHALTEPQKQQLFSAVADAIPGGSYLSTWGDVSKGGLAGLKRFTGLGFKPTLQTRTLGLKTLPTVGEVFPFGELKADKIEVPVLYKPREVVAGSRPISEAEAKGTIKMERNQPTKEKTHFDWQIDGIYDRLASSKPRVRLPYTEEQILNELDPEIADNMRYSRGKFLKQNDDQVQHYLDFSGDAKDFRTKLSDFINRLDINVAPEFNNTVVDGISERNPYIIAYRNYLYQNGVDAAGITDENLAKFLTYMQQMQRSGMTGKMKDRVPLWHGSKDMFDAFDWKLTGKNTGNSGAIGPGNYFSARGIMYGGATGKLDIPLNFQPYYITGIESMPNGFMMQEKGILPEYMNRFAIREHPDLFKAALEKDIPGSNTTLYIDPTEPMQGMFDAPQAGFMLRRNTGIKSLFPHPSRFVRNADGTVSLIPTDWSDIRVNYKQGGKI